MPGFPRLKDAYDFVVVGGGHAGLQAGLKAALLNYTAVVIDRGPKYGRSYYAPRMDNIPGFPEGVSGHELLDRQIAAVRRVEEKVGYFTPARATAARRSADGGYEVDFEWLKQPKTARGRVLVLAMGVVDRMPVVEGKINPIFPWANFAIVDFCILCDGHDLKGRTVAVIGHEVFAAKTALDLLHFEPTSVEILTHGQPWLPDASPEERPRLEAQLAEARISRHDPAMVGFDKIREKRFGVKFADGSYREYERGFSGLGFYDMNNALPQSLGAELDAEGYVRTDGDCRVLERNTHAPIPGLYCVGDLRSDWNQIPHAWWSAEEAVVHAYAHYL